MNEQYEGKDKKTKKFNLLTLLRKMEQQLHKMILDYNIQKILHQYKPMRVLLAAR